MGSSRSRSGSGPDGMQAALRGDNAVSFVRRAMTDGREAQASDHAALLDEWPMIYHFTKNTDKNRCAETLLYDQTRVQLRGADGPYVHATRAAKQPFGSFVLTQGPLANTAADLWRTVWQENVYVIVCLAQLDSKASETVEYWPARKSKTVKVGSGRSRFNVRRLSEKKEGEAILRELAVKCKERGKKTEQRRVYHLHYGGWPAAAVCPPSARVLLQVVNTMWNTDETVRQMIDDEAAAAAERPVLVHCSDGAGRSGTFVALSLLCRELYKTKKASVARTALRLRQKRGGALEQPSQHAFLYAALLEFAGRMNIMRKDEISRASAMLSSVSGARTSPHDSSV